MHLTVQILSANSQLNYFFLASMFSKIRISQTHTPPHTPFAHNMGEDKQIFLFFQLPVLFPTWNIPVIKWCKADKIERRKCSFLHLQKRLQLSELVYYSRSSNSRCLTSNFSNLVIWHSSVALFTANILLFLCKGSLITMLCWAFKTNSGCHHPRICVFKFSLKKRQILIWKLKKPMDVL